MSDVLDSERGPLLGVQAPHLDVIGDKGKNGRSRAGWTIFFSHPGDLLPAFKIKTISYVLCKRKIRAVALTGEDESERLLGTNLIDRYMLRHTLSLVKDEGGIISRSYGVGYTDTGDHGGCKGLFVIDPMGVLRMKIISPLRTNRSFSEIMSLVEALQAADRKNGKRERKPKVWERAAGKQVKSLPAAEFE